MGRGGGWGGVSGVRLGVRVETKAQKQQRCFVNNYASHDVVNAGSCTYPHERADGWFGGFPGRNIDVGHAGVPDVLGRWDGSSRCDVASEEEGVSGDCQEKYRRRAAQFEVKE